MEILDIKVRGVNYGCKKKRSCNVKFRHQSVITSSFYNYTFQLEFWVSDLVYFPPQDRWVWIDSSRICHIIVPLDLTLWGFFLFCFYFSLYNRILVIIKKKKRKKRWRKKLDAVLAVLICGLRGMSSFQNCDLSNENPWVSKITNWQETEND